MLGATSLPRTLGALRRSSEFCESRVSSRSVKDEIRANLIQKLRTGETLFPGIIGFDDTVVPQIVNAILSRHNFILLGLRGQAKSRILRQLATLLDPLLPVIAGSEINDNPYLPLSRFGTQLVREKGDETPIEFLTPDQRYIEKLATPDVTIADMIGDIDPIKAARGGHHLADELTIHFGLLPRANRGIFAINELPDLMGKIQVGLFNIMQEGDVQIKGYPVRLPLDVMLVFSANPEDYTARGKIITPLKDRIGSEIRTHYPLDIEHALSITGQEAWEQRESGEKTLHIPRYVREIVETVAFAAREDRRIDKRSGVSQRLPISCMENVISNAERRAFLCDEAHIAPRVSDIYAALPSITGKFELEYEGELKGADRVAHELIKIAVGKVFDQYFEGADMTHIVQWFEIGGTLKVTDSDPAAEALKQLSSIQGLIEASQAALEDGDDAPELQASAAEFVLDGLYAHRRITRSEEVGYSAEVKKRERARRRDFAQTDVGDTYN